MFSKKLMLSFTDKVTTGHKSLVLVIIKSMSVMFYEYRVRNKSSSTSKLIKILMPVILLLCSTNTESAINQALLQN